ncbi:hypothetical protein Tco_0839785 [Tanacetum coccineum]|uniref:Uncharacterized protein n=1 Tax=Tanacetum coccineum TaxID=301880 RepID=A0ABQ5AVH5_9ASTR
MGLHIAQEIESIGFSAYWAESVRQIPDKGDLSAYWIGILSAGYLLSATPSYTSIRDLMLRLCHRLITCSIAGRGQAPKKVTVTDLFYLRGMDVGSVNIPYLLARYLRLFASGMKHGVMISWDLLVIDMAELVRLQICVELDDTWAWVALGPERQQVATAGTPKASEDAPVSHEGAPAIPAPVQAPQPLPPVAGQLRLCLRDDESGWGQNKPGRPRCKEIDDVGKVSTVWKSRSVGVLKLQDGCSIHILAHKLNLENLPSKMLREFLILILLNSSF